MIFRKPKVEEKQTPASAEPAQQAPVEHQEAPPPATSEPAASVLTADVVMEGNLVTSGELHLNGTVHGAVQAARVVIDVNGAVNGQVVAEEIIIRGRVIGPICGVRVHLLPGAQVEGDVMSHGIVVEDGAFIDGQIRHSDDPLGEWQQMWYGDEDVARDDTADVSDPASDAADAQPEEASYLRRAGDVKPGDDEAESTAKPATEEDSKAVSSGERG